jgi:hypothetical protein
MKIVACSAIIFLISSEIKKTGRLKVSEQADL